MMLSPFLDQVRDPRRGIISPQRISSALNLPLTRIAEIAQVHRNTLAQRPDSPAVQQRLGDVARVIVAAADLLGGDTARAIIWFKHQPLAGFDGQTAEQLIAAGHADAVSEHLEMMRDGIPG
jgi:uncharacterized protein (DUF2384 family)